MSMVGNLTRIPEAVREALRNNPNAIYGWLYPESVELTATQPGFFARLLGRRPKERAIPPEPLHRLADTDTIDLDKAWHALHFLFTESDWDGAFPQGFLVACGEPVDDVDVGYGPARAFTSDRVASWMEFVRRQWL